MRHNYKHRNVSHLIEDLIDQAWNQRLVYTPMYRGRSSFPEAWQKPGALIEKLSEEDRKLLTELTTRDFEHRVDAAIQWLGVCGEYAHQSRYTKGLIEQRRAAEKR